jgi:hypothetical protein
MPEPRHVSPRETSTATAPYVDAGNLVLVSEGLAEHLTDKAAGPRDEHAPADGHASLLVTHYTFVCTITTVPERAYT